MDIELEVDPDRLDDDGLTGIFVRAKANGKWGSWDIACLTTDSLDYFLRSRGSIDWPINVVKAMLGHKH